MKSSSRWRLNAVLVLSLTSACDLINPANSQDYSPSRLPVGELTLSTWLPAGLPDFRLTGQDESNLVNLGLTEIEWLQRVGDGDSTAEELAMGFCDRTGLTMPVYYEAPGFSPYDKLHNWATKSEVGPDFEEAVRARVLGLKSRWTGSAGFGGYLIGHEDYSNRFYEALGQTVSVLRSEDPGRPAVTVGNIDHYSHVDRFLDAFFDEEGVPNIFQHEHYVFRAATPTSGRGLQRNLDDLVAGYGRVARHLQDRLGRWHAIVQVQSETRDGNGEQGLYYRKPTGAEIAVQAGLALARGASGIVYFLYSSGIEEVPDGNGNLLQLRVYEGIVDVDGTATPTYEAVQRLNAQLSALSPILAPLHFHGGYASSRGLPDDAPVVSADDDLELGFFGNREIETHVLVVNRRPEQARAVRLVITAQGARDALSGEELAIDQGTITLNLDAGGMQLVELIHSANESDG
jgi:hypothetical protein